MAFRHRCPGPGACAVNAEASISLLPSDALLWLTSGHRQDARLGTEAFSGWAWESSAAWPAECLAGAAKHRYSFCAHLCEVRIARIHKEALEAGGQLPNLI